MAPGEDCAPACSRAAGRIQKTGKTLLFCATFLLIPALAVLFTFAAAVRCEEFPKIQMAAPALLRLAMATATGTQTLPAPAASDNPAAPAQQISAPPAPAEKPKTSCEKAKEKGGKPSCAADADGDGPVDGPNGPPKEVYDPLQHVKTSIRGYRYLMYRDFQSSGNERRFRSLSGLASHDNKIEQGTNLDVSANFDDRLTFDANFYDMPRQERLFYVKAHGRRAEAQMGDFTLSFPGGGFTSFSKNISGVWAAVHAANYNLGMFGSESKSTTQTESFQGRNSKGPYDLKASDIIETSVVVKVDNVVLSPSAYSLNAFSGEISFNEILTPSQVILVTYERKLFSLDAGNLNGIAADYSWKKRGLDFSYSRLAQSSSQSPEQVVQTETGQILYLEGKTLRLEESKTLVKESETIRAPNGRILIRGVDYTVGDAQYFVGEFTLADANAFDLSDPEKTFTIDYSHYLSAVVQHDVELNLFDVNEPLFNKVFEPNIYAGSESVQICPYSAQTCNVNSFCDALDPNETDPAAKSYIIDESSNSIELVNFTLNESQCLHITYAKTPFSGGAAAVDQTVDDFRAVWQARPKTKLTFETAGSEADLGGKPIPVVAERVALVATATSCPSELEPDPCQFKLAHAPVVDNSASVFFNDSTSSDAVLSRNRYTIDLETGTLRIRNFIPANTLIIANYQFNPASAGLETGRVTQISAEGSAGKLNYRASLFDGDTRFSPIGRENNLETSRIAASGDYKVSDKLAVSHSFAKIETARDIESIQTVETVQTNTRANYRSARIKSLTVYRATQEVQDNLAVKAADSSRSGTGFSLEAPAPRVKNLFLTLEKESRTDTDNANKSEQKTDKNALGFQYSRGARLAIAWKTTDNAVETRTALDRYKSTNTAREINVSYRPHPMVAASAKISSQDVVDSRPNISGSQSNRSTINLAVEPFWRITGLTHSITKEDRPSLNTASSANQNTRTGFALNINPTWRWTPSWTENNTRVGQNRTDAKTFSWRLEFRPPGSNYSITYGQSTSDRNSLNSSDLQTVSQDDQTMDFFWRPGSKVALSGRWDNQKNGSTAAGDNWESDTFSLRSTFNPAPKWSMNLNWRRQERAGAFNNVNTTTSLDWTYRLTKILNWEFLYRKISDSDERDAKQNFDGSMIETTIKAEFK